MARNPILDLPLINIMRSEIALPLQQMMHLYTVGNFLKAWGNPRNHKSIEQVFDSPEQAHHAATICAAWLGIRISVAHDPSLGWWWPADESRAMQA
ncbi:MAG TPA: hypothetical protein VHX86_12380 [Tepidisphaeraceae bacterium]|jgi:hypothetical protein|nr:hypothetical protein [Tepidisphaeraceae bacterium]